MPTLGFLHTSPVHVATFDALTLDRGADVQIIHSVREDLLRLAREQGVEAAAPGVRAALESLVADGVDRIVCTCSTIGGVAEAAEVAGAAGVNVPVTRVDRPMVAEAVRTGSRIGVIVAVESTIEPTLALVRQEADAAGIAASTSTRVVLAADAWRRFEDGDLEGYVAAIVDAVRSLAPHVDVVMLAQASMAPAADAAGEVSVPVLTSPRIAVERAVEALVAG